MSGLFRLRRAAAVGVLSACLGAGANAQSLTLSDALRLAVERSQQVVAADAAAQAARESAVAAGQLPDPVLKLGVENVPLSGPERFSLSKDFMTMRRIGVMQELTRSDKRRLKVERAEREGQRAQAERQMALAEVQRETALAWIDRVYTQGTLTLLREQAAETELQVQGAEVAFRAGRGSPADVFAGRAAVANLQDRVRLTQRQQQSATLMLARWIGSEAAARPPAGLVDWRSSSAAHLSVDEHVRLLPRLLQLQAEVAAAETELKQAQANRRADWTVEATYSQRGSAFSDMVSIGVSIPLQWDRPHRQDREVAAKAAMLEQARARYEDAVRGEQAAVGVLLNEWSTDKARLDQLTAELVPAARNRTEAALAAYRAGKGDLAAVLAARRDEVDARMQLLSLEMEVARGWARLNYLVPDPALASRQDAR